MMAMYSPAASSGNAVEDDSFAEALGDFRLSTLRIVLAMTQLATGAQRGAFDEWVDAMRAWQREIDVTPDADVVLTTRFSDLLEPEIRYGRYAGERRWKVGDIPAPRIKDELLQLIVWQGDSEVRAVEQARELLDSAPSDHDRRRLVRHMTEETRHGWRWRTSW